MSASMQSMIEAGVHFGHQTKFWNPKMKPYIFGARNKIHIINLDKTVVLFDNAVKFIKQVVGNKGTVLFVGTRSQASEIVAEEAMRAGMPYVDHRWLGGMLTNFETVKKSIKKLEVKSGLLEQSGETGLSKKELLDLSRDIAKLQSSIGGIVTMKELPSALFIVDTGCHGIAIKEAKKLGIPVVGVVDTNNDPSEVDYVIPGNDDSAKAIRLYASTISDAIIKAKESVIGDLVQQVKVEMVEDNADAKQRTIRRVKSADVVADAATEVKVENTKVEANVAVAADEVIGEVKKASVKKAKPEVNAEEAKIDAKPKTVRKVKAVDAEEVSSDDNEDKKPRRTKKAEEVLEEAGS